MINVIIGANKNIRKLDVLGITVSLASNLNASAMACKSPKIPTVFGPLLRCIEAIILRSINVKKATDNNKGSNKGKNFNQSIFKFKNKIKKILLKKK
jgi:hypothetical protein